MNANIETLPCFISASWYSLNCSSVIPLEKPAGSKNPNGAELPTLKDGLKVDPGCPFGISDAEIVESAASTIIICIISVYYKFLIPKTSNISSRFKSPIVCSLSLELKIGLLLFREYLLRRL